jgi:hypothetical protein
LPFCAYAALPRRLYERKARFDPLLSTWAAQIV